MGILRLYLAICVIFAHSEQVLPWRSHGGREAVQIFFIISGFYMQLILGGDKYTSIRSFYQGRALRIFVPYWIVTTLIVLTSLITGLVFGEWLTLTATVHHAENGTAGIAFATLTNVSVFFQDWVLFFKHDAGETLMLTSNFGASEHGLWHYLWIPQAWSVGIELTFYLFAPFLVRKLSSLYLLLVVLISLGARLFCYSQLGLAHDPWSYRFFPFEIIHFCYGILGCRLLERFPSLFGRLSLASDQFAAKIGALFYPIVTISVLVILWLHVHAFRLLGSFSNDYIHGGNELVYLVSLSMWIITIPILFSLTRRLRFDRFVGELSYPVYLLHYTIVLIVSAVLSGMQLPRSLHGEISTVLSIAFAVLLQICMLQSFENWRQSAIKRRAYKAMNVRTAL